MRPSRGTGNFSSAVTWSASAGTVNAAGLFTAPASAGTVTVTATSVQDTTQSGTRGSPCNRRATVTEQAHRHGVRRKHQLLRRGSQCYWPNLNNLISNGALATNYYANSHPSIGNYFMLTTGKLLTTNDNSTTVWNVDNIARRMLAAGVPFRIYAEGISQGYVGGDTGPYLLRHNPFAMLSDIASNPQVANKTSGRSHSLPPISQTERCLNSPSSFPINDDAHDGTPQQADSWLQSKVVAPLVR